LQRGVRGSIPPAIALVFALAALACGEEPVDTSVNGASPVSEVRSSAACAPPLCQPIDEIEGLVGFRPLEPSELPAGFALYSRQVPARTFPSGPREGLAGNQPPEAGTPEAAQPVAVTIEYRLHGSPHIHALIITETVLPPSLNDPTLKLAGDGCGERVVVRGAAAIYGRGSGMLSRGSSLNEWLACAQKGPTDRDVHVLFLIRGNLLIQIKAFPEAGITREQILEVAASLSPQ